MTCYKLTWTDANGSSWFNLMDTMEQALEFASTRPLEEVSRIDIQKCNISNLADVQPIPVSLPQSS